MRQKFAAWRLHNLQRVHCIEHSPSATEHDTTWIGAVDVANGQPRIVVQRGRGADHDAIKQGPHAMRVMQIRLLPIHCD